MASARPILLHSSILRMPRIPGSTLGRASSSLCCSSLSSVSCKIRDSSIYNQRLKGQTASFHDGAQTSQAVQRGHAVGKDAAKPLRLRNMKQKETHKKHGVRPEIKSTNKNRLPRVSSQPSKAESKTEPAPNELRNCDFIVRTYGYPDRNDYPQAPNTIFDVDQLIYNPSQTFQGGLVFGRGKFRQLGKGRFCQFSVEATDQQGQIFRGVGEGYMNDKIGARKAAMMDIMAQLHKNGWLKEVFSAPAALDLDLNTIKTKVDAKTDVYNYCARFGLLPRFHVSKPSPEDLIKSKRSMLRRRKGSKEYQAQITLPEQDITVLGFGTSYLSAEIAASVSFKQKVEERARSQQSESFSVLHPYALTSFSAAQFYKFYRTLHKGVQFEYASTQASVFGTSLQQSQMTHNGLPLGEVALMPTKKQAEELAALIGAVTLAQREAGLLQQFQDALKHGKGQILARVLPRELVVNREMAMTMRKTARDAARQGLHSFRDEIIAELETTSVKLRRRASSPRYLEQRSQQLLSRATGEGSATRDMEEMRQKRNELPMSKHKAEVLNLVNENSYSIIVGATGSGKTTQVPQILLEDAIEAGQGATCNVICTQPRRIAATSVARRVASERGEQLGDTVGYHVRNDRKPPNSNGGITYCTTGILLQQLKSNADLTLEGVSHIVIDEVHERDLFVDFLLVVLKTALANRVAEGKPIPKVTLMSATMDTELFADYFKSTTPSGEIKPCPSLVVPGRLFPVTSTHVDSLLGDMRKSYSHAQLSPLLNELDTKSYIEREIQFTKGKAAVLTSDAEDDDAIPTINWRSSESTTEEGWRYNPDDGLVPVGLVAATIAHVVNTSEDGSILVFLPGKEEILRVQRLIERSPVLGVDLNDRSRFKLHILHSSTPAEQQAAVFLPTSEGCRKIILATNIAETSVTIPDVQHVIDSGKLRERRYDFARQIDALLCTWISKANSRQRAGRAGRVQNGNYYALFSQERFESLRVAGEPEMLRADLQEVGLMIKAHGFNMSIANFLEQSVQPPSRMAVQTAIENLKAVKALTENEDLTELGRVLSGLHVNPSLGKMIVMGIVFRCLDSVILLGALIGSRSMFLRPAGQRREYEPMHRLFVGKARSDHLSGLNAYRTLRKIHVEYGEAEARRFAVEHYLSMSAFNAITSTCQEIMKELMESGLIPKTDIPKKLQSRFGDDNLNENSENGALLKGLLIGGLSSNIAVHTGNRFFRTAGESDVMIHPSSLNAPPREERADYRGASFVYSALAQSSGDSRLMLRDTTEVSPLEIALFGGKLQESTKHSVLEMDGWLPFWVKGDRYGRSDLLLEFRSTFEKAFSAICQDISRLRKQSSQEGDDLLREEREYVTDLPLCETIETGVVHVLRDAARTPKEHAQESGRRFLQRP